MDRAQNFFNVKVLWLQKFTGWIKFLEFECLKVKTLEEIREEKQLASVAMPTSFRGPRQSYNLIYTPSHPHTSSSSQTSFKLTSVLKTTGLTGGRRSPGPQAAATKTTTLTGTYSNPISHSVTAESAHISHPFAPQTKTTAKYATPTLRLKVGGANMVANDPSKSLFNSAKNSSSVFSPNYKPPAVNKPSGSGVRVVSGAEEKEGVRVVRGEEGKKEGVRVVRGEEEKREGVRVVRGGEEEKEGVKMNISAITWGDEGGRKDGEREKEMGLLEVKKESRIVRFQQTSSVGQLPSAKKVCTGSSLLVCLFSV